jgi:hypothetical protein
MVNAFWIDSSLYHTSTCRMAQFGVINGYMYFLSGVKPAIPIHTVAVLKQSGNYRYCRAERCRLAESAKVVILGGFEGDIQPD